jgi:ATP-grasp domain
MENQKIILVVGYSKISYLKSIKKDPLFSGTKFICAYTRRPTTPGKIHYLETFDELFDLTIENDQAKLAALGPAISAITCTQDRDIIDYINVMLLTHKITAAEHLQWLCVSNKHTFKEKMREQYPELVPYSKLIQKDEVPTLPAIVKPLGLAGSAFVALIKNKEAYAEYLAFTLVDNEGQPRTKQIQFITEEYIAGPQYSINTYVTASGKITFCPIIRVVPAMELGIDDNYSALQYVTSELTEEQTKQLHASIEKIVSFFSIHSTSAHFDVVYDGQDFKFFEVGLRIGGLRQEMFIETHDVNHFSNDIRNKLGHNITIPPQKKSLCIIQKASAAVGIIAEINYSRSITAEDRPLLSEHKFRKFDTVVKPVKVGGAVTARFLMSGTDGSAVLTESHRLFENISIILK